MTLEYLTYIGPPGTGKTTTLLGEVEKFINAGARPDRIGFMSFTRQAVNEAIARTRRKPEEVPYFRTIHSLCFRLCGLSTTSVMGQDEYRDLGDALGLELTGSFDRRKSVEELSQADRALAFVEMCRATMSDLKETWETTPEADEVDWRLVDLVAKGLKKFKDENLLVDYTGMIEKYLATGPVPPLDALIVDEAQDLSLLQWKAVEKMSSNCKKLIIAGDDDQALYYWAGSRPEIFQEFSKKGEAIVLGKSHRLPKAVYKTAEKIIGGVKCRLKKDYSPRDAEGLVEERASYDDVDMSTGDWLVLVRNRYMIKAAVDHCRREGYHYRCFLDTPQEWDSVKALVAWERLRKGEVLKPKEVSLPMLFTKDKKIRDKFDKILRAKGQTYSRDFLAEETGANFSRPWFEALDVRPDEAEYVRAALRRGEKLTRPPRIGIDTIHGSKGGEAENVVLKTDVSARTMAAAAKDPDPERRVFYVGATRAKSNLYLLRPETPNFFDVEAA